MGEVHRLFASSTDSKLIYSDNNAISFTIELAKPIVLSGHWEIALNEIEITSTLDTPSCVYICSDICSDSFVGSSLIPVLRHITLKRNYKKIYVQPYFSKVTRDWINNITFYVSSENKEVLKHIQHISLVATIKWHMSM
jgi:hypothetical protein